MGFKQRIPIKRSRADLVHQRKEKKTQKRQFFAVLGYLQLQHWNERLKLCVEFPTKDTSTKPNTKLSPMNHEPYTLLNTGKHLYQLLLFHKADV